MFHVEHQEVPRSVPRGTDSWVVGGPLTDIAVRNQALRVLSEGLEALELPRSSRELDFLLRLAALLERWAGRINLTAHRSLDAILRDLILEACALLAQLPPDLAGLADLGSGAGFPGLPIAILRPSWSLTLVEARQRRHHFQKAAVRALGLPNVTLLQGRAEILEPQPQPAVIAQAVGAPARVLEWMRRWAVPGGLLLLPGSDPSPQVPEIEGISKVRRIRYRVPCGGRPRTLWIGRVSCGMD
jgi:16S rRNA (guanine527-N7)-methyltransferase